MHEQCCSTTSYLVVVHVIPLYLIRLALSWGELFESVLFSVRKSGSASGRSGNIRLRTLAWDSLHVEATRRNLCWYQIRLYLVVESIVPDLAGALRSCYLQWNS